MRIILTFAVTWLFCTLGGCSIGTPPRTVDQVDLAKYSGIWYEIARIPQSYEAGCTNSTATYSILPNNQLSIVNRCQEKDGKPREVRGVARSTNPPANSRLKVRLGGPIEGDYWVFRLDSGYTTAVVGSPDRQSLWILSRLPVMESGQYQQLVASLKGEGLPADRLERTRR